MGGGNGGDGGPLDETAIRQVEYLDITYLLQWAGSDLSRPGNTACMFAGESFAELGENPANETARKVSSTCAVTACPWCEPSCLQTGVQLVSVPCRLFQSSLLTSFRQCVHRRTVSY